LSVGVAAHAIHRAGGASAKRIGVATWMFGDDGDGTIRAANDGTLVVKGVVLTEVNNETGVLGTSGESDGGADLNAERRVGFGVGETRFRGGVVAPAAPDVDNARRRSGAASVGLSADACGIGRGANVILNLLLGALANDETCHQRRNDEQTASCKIAINPHWAPRPLKHAESKTSNIQKAKRQSVSWQVVRARTSQMLLLEWSARLVPVDNIG